MLQIRLLGQFDARMDGKRVTIPTRAAQSLLAYLVLTAGTAHRREKLAGLLWPDTTEENARKNLRQELWRIRKAISAQQTAEQDYLIADEFTLKFNRDADYWLDVSQMERPDLDLQTLIANLSLYQGELLSGFYDEWLSLERERVQAVFDARMEQLLEQLTTAERWIAVQEWGERWLTYSGAREPAFRALMLASSARGDMAKVASLYQRCTDELMENLGVEPSAETRALYNELVKNGKTPSHTAVAQPSGTITFLFTDIEGSTRLLETMGDQYAAALAKHHEIMRAAIQKWNGREMDTQGDAFFITFARALDAVQCAAEAQRGLTAHTWQGGETLRVRMGLHTGEPLIGSTGYVGMDVHRAARIGDAGHGGQILLSQTTRELVVQDLPEGMTIRDLGEYRLKDMKYPSSIYQLVVDGLPAEFPTIRTKFSGAEAPTPGEAPFKGLQFFDVDDSELFFGREVLTAKLMDRLKGADFLSVIIGASGSGKSSLVRASLVPSIKKSNADWRVHILTPTAHPLEALAFELTRDSESVTATATLVDDLSKDPRSLYYFLSRRTQSHHTLLVIDQFEELFTLCRDEFEREAFIDNLLAALAPPSLPLGEARKGEGNITLVITLRADFYAHLAQYPELRDAVAQGQEYIGPMTSEELRRAIEEPARRGHWEFEPGLVDLILRDVGNEPGALPLLSHALLETWKRRAGHTLTLKGYADAGGVHGAIAHTAESLYQTFSPDEQTITSNILLRLTEFGDGTEDTRRRASFNELMSHTEDADSVRSVLNRLADARLVTVSEDSAEVAHEALIREWPQLREWLSQDREGNILHRRLTEAAQEWELLERDPGMLYRGARLAQANEWSALNPNVLNAQERLFLEASNRQAQQEEQEREDHLQRELEAAKELAETQRLSASRLRIRNRVITTVGSIAVILALLAGTFGVQSSRNAITAQNNAATAQIARDDALNAEANAQAERDRADKTAAIAFSRELAVQAKLNLTVDPERSILLALAALDQGYSPEAENVLHEAVLASRLRMTLRGHEGPVNGVAYSPDGKLIATASLDQTARLWNATTGEELLRLEHSTEVWDVLFTPDGTRLATSTRNGVIRIWDVDTGKEVLTIIAAGEGTIQTFPIFFMAVSPDGKLLATVFYGENQVKFWDLASGVEQFTLSDPGWVAVASNVDLLPTEILFSPDGTRLAISLGSDELGLGRIEIWDVETHQKVQTLAGRFDPFLPMSFSPDGARLAAPRGPTSDERGAVWDVSSGELLFSLKDGGNAITYSADGKRLLFSRSGGRINVLDAETVEELLLLVGHTGYIIEISESPGCVKPPTAPFDWCSTHIASASGDGTVRIWDISPTGSQELLTVPGSDFVLSEDGTRLSTVIIPPYSPGGVTVSIHDWVLPADLQSIQSLGFNSSSIEVDAGYRWNWLSPDGIQVTPFEDGPLKFWDVLAGGKAVYPISCCAWTEGMLTWFSSRQTLRQVIGDSRTGTAVIWDLAKDEEIQTFQVAEPSKLQYIFISPDGERLVTTNFDRSVYIWDVITGQKLLTLPGPTTVDNGFWFSADGKWLAIADCNGTVVVWDVISGEEKLRFSGTTACINAVAFSPDGKLLAVSAGNGGLRILDFETGQELLRLPGGWEVEFTPDGRRVIVATEDEQGRQIVRVYLLRLEDIVALAKTRVTRSLTTEECQQYLHVEVCPTEP